MSSSLYTAPVSPSEEQIPDSQTLDSQMIAPIDETLNNNISTDYISAATHASSNLPSADNKFMFTSLEALVAQATNQLPQNRNVSPEVPKNLFEAVLSSIDHEKVSKGCCESGEYTTILFVKIKHYFRKNMILCHILYLLTHPPLYATR